MNKPQIVGIRKGGSAFMNAPKAPIEVKEKPKVGKEDRNKGEGRSHGSKGKKKFEVRHRALKDGSPMFLAFGVIRGKLIVKPGRLLIHKVTGGKEKLLAVKDQKLMVFLLTMREVWEDKVLNLIVYPAVDGAFTLCGVDAEGKAEPGEFTIQGGYNQKNSASDRFTLFVGRNRTDQSGFTMINIEGSVPEGTSDRALLRCRCRLDGGKFYLVDVKGVE